MASCDQPLLPIKCVKCGLGCIAPIMREGHPHHRGCLPPIAKVKLTGAG